MTKSRYLSGVILVAALAMAGSGCVVRGRGGFYASPGVVVVESDPPPPRVYVAPVRPGYLYIDGRWDWRGGQWVWLDGHYERERVGYIWAPGRWERRGRGRVWVEGNWRQGGRGRGHQDVHVDNDRRGNDKDGGVIVRDHRR